MRSGTPSRPRGLAAWRAPSPLAGEHVSEVEGRGIAFWRRGSSGRKTFEVIFCVGFRLNGFKNNGTSEDTAVWRELIYPFVIEDEIQRLFLAGGSLKPS